MASRKDHEHVPTSVVDNSEREKTTKPKRERPGVKQNASNNACFSEDVETSRNEMAETSKSVASTEKTVSIKLSYMWHSRV